MCVIQSSVLDSSPEVLGRFPLFPLIDLIKFTDYLHWNN